MADGGVDCYKVSYGRGAGKIIPGSPAMWGIIIGSCIGAAVATVGLAVATGGISLVAETEIVTTIAAAEEESMAAITMEAPSNAWGPFITSQDGATIFIR